MACQGASDVGCRETLLAGDRAAPAGSSARVRPAATTVTCKSAGLQPGVSVWFVAWGSGVVGSRSVGCAR
eukprot:12692434-Alexandrium_andersonii.AAC.1